MSSAVGWGDVFKQFNFVTAGRFQNRELKLRSCDAGNLTGHFASLMRVMRKLESEHVAPESKRALEIRDRDASVIRGKNADWTPCTRALAHARNRSRKERPTRNALRPTSKSKENSERFDSLASHSLNLRPSRPSRGFRRSILDFARNDTEGERVFIQPPRSL